MKKIKRIPTNLTEIIQNIYEPAGLKITSTVEREIESVEYEACCSGKKIAIKT